MKERKTIKKITQEIRAKKKIEKISKEDMKKIKGGSAKGGRVKDLPSVR